jgi:heme-degrading monooxygenase HmoA
MAVKVLIKRRFKEGKAKEVITLLNELRSGAMAQTGYITGESLINIDDPQKVLVISTWQSIDNWLKWSENSSRKANESRLEPYLEEPADYEAYAFGAYPTKKK